MDNTEAPPRPNSESPRLGTSAHTHIRVNNTWTPKVCRIMAFRVIIMGLRLLFYLLLGFRY